MPDPRQQFVEPLQNGQTVQFRCNGKSMVPRIYPKQLLTIEPIADHTQLAVNDAVFCKVNKSLTVHLVTAIKGKGEDLQFQISNNHGHVNGWINWKHVYGKFIKAE